jgi:hypothetical protein
MPPFARCPRSSRRTHGGAPLGAPDRATRQALERARSPHHALPRLELLERALSHPHVDAIPWRTAHASRSPRPRRRSMVARTSFSGAYSSPRYVFLRGGTPGSPTGPLLEVVRVTRDAGGAGRASCKHTIVLSTPRRGTSFVPARSGEAPWRRRRERLGPSRAHSRGLQRQAPSRRSARRGGSASPGR